MFFWANGTRNWPENVGEYCEDFDSTADYAIKSLNENRETWYTEYDTYKDDPELQDEYQRFIYCFYVFRNDLCESLDGKVEEDDNLPDDFKFRACV